MSEQFAVVRNKVLAVIVGIGRLQGVSNGSDPVDQLEGFKQDLAEAEGCFQQFQQGGLLCADEIQELRKMLFDLEEEIDEFEHGCCIEA